MAASNKACATVNNQTVEKKPQTFLINTKTYYHLLGFLGIFTTSGVSSHIHAKDILTSSLSHLKEQSHPSQLALEPNAL
jgi:hypothetical protein